MCRYRNITISAFSLAFLFSSSALAQPPANVPAGNGGLPVTVEDSINATLRTHRNIKILQENRTVLEEELVRAKAGYGPRVDANARFGGSQLSNTTTRPLGTDKGMYGSSSVGITLTQPLWDGYATRSRVRTAESTLESLQHRVYDNGTSLALDSIIAHIDLTRRRKILDLAQTNVSRHEELLVSARDREKMGADTMADVTQAEGRLARAHSSLVEARANLLSAEATYRRLTSLPVPVQIVSVPKPEPMFPSVREVLTTAENDNPKIKAYMSDVKAAQGQQELAESTYHPTFNLEAGPNYSDRRGPGSQWTSSMDVMGVVRWNIFNSGADRAENRAAAARVRQSRQTLYNLMDELVLQGDEAWTRYKEAMGLFETYTRAMEYNRLTKDAYLEQFFTGQRRLLDVLDAENELFNSSTQATTAEGNILVSMYKLYALSGRLLNVLHVDVELLKNIPDENDPAPRM